MNSNPYSKLKFNPAPYDSAKTETAQEMQNVYDASISSAQNQSAMAGSVQGVANPQRFSADTASRMYENRDQKIASNAAANNQQKASAETAFNRQRDIMSAEFEASKPNFFDYLSFGTNFLGGAGNMLSSLGVFDKWLSPEKTKPIFSGDSFNPVRASNATTSNNINIGDLTNTGENIKLSLTDKKMNNNYDFGQSTYTKFTNPWSYTLPFRPFRLRR